ncbi:MAG: type II secretion system F family protein [Lentisphaerae bacterium]|nr:type II secretion system F family protein [Lentisphaerota bacterium]
MSPVVRRSNNQPRPGRPPSGSRAARGGRPAAASSPRGRRTRVPGAGKIVSDLLPGFSRQLSAMLAAGMPIVSALEALEEQTDNKNFKQVVTHVRLNIENGSALSDALRQYPSVFDDLYCNMVRGGESGGQLAETIGRLAGFLEASARLRRKVRSAMMYPAIVFCIAMAIATAMIVFIVPVFGDMFADFGAELPGPTQALIDLSNGMRAYGLYVLAAVVAGVILFKKWKATEAGGMAFHGFLLRTPVFGELNRKVVAARFARTFGHLIKSGVPILHALNIVSGATGNKLARRVILDARNGVEKGEPLSTALGNQTVFPIMVVRMLQAGEKTGRVDEMMDRIANYYDDEVDTMLAGLTSMLEPLLMVFLGVVIGGIVLCMFLPIFKMGEVVSR